MVMGDKQFEHPQNVFLTKIINLNERLQTSDDAATGGAHALERKIGTWIQLQEAVNTLMDSSKSENARNDTAGIRQLLEKKEGLFRKNMVSSILYILIYMRYMC